MAIKVSKFGGSSLADAAQIRKVQTIVEADAARRYVIPSAPGKRHQQDQKITDMLYLCHETARQNLPIDDLFHRISERYLSIVNELGLDLDLTGDLEQVRAGIIRHAGEEKPADFAASRGEFLNGRIIAALLGYSFVDAAEIIRFNDRGRLDEARTYPLIARRLEHVEKAVVPGFYGALPDGSIKTFSRGGSDVTGAIIARGVMATVYENWTDVSGLLMADPRVVENPRHIDVVTYRELRELSYMGAHVLHDEAVFPVRNAGIPVNIRNTNEPQHLGTTIVSMSTNPKVTPGTICGIAGRKDFTVVAIEKTMMNAERGFGRRVLGVFEANGVNFEHMPTGIDTLSIVVADSEINGKIEKVLAGIESECEPDVVEVYPDMALIATVGRGMAHTPGMAAKLFQSLANARVNIRMIDQGSSELNIIVGVAVEDFETAVRAIYHAFVD